jgi:hypothetical protein
MPYCFNVSCQFTLCVLSDFWFIALWLIYLHLFESSVFCHDSDDVEHVPSVTSAPKLFIIPFLFTQVKN